jgi:hypothetical protein
MPITVPYSETSSARTVWTKARGEKRRQIQAIMPRPMAQELCELLDILSTPKVNRC